MKLSLFPNLIKKSVARGFTLKYVQKVVILCESPRLPCSFILFFCHTFSSFIHIHIVFRLWIDFVRNILQDQNKLFLLH